MSLPSCLSRLVAGALAPAVTCLGLSAPASAAPAVVPIGDEVPVAQSLPNGDAQIAWVKNRYIVVWAAEAGDQGEAVYKREFSATGAPVGGTTVVAGPPVSNEASRDEPEIAAAPNGSYAVVWMEDEDEVTGPDSGWDIKMRRYDETGAAGPIAYVSFAPGEVLLEDYDEEFPAVAVTASGTPVVTWNEENGNVVGRNLAVTPSPDVVLSDAALGATRVIRQPDGGFVVANVDVFGGPGELLRFSALGGPAGSATAANSDRLADIAPGPAGAVVGSYLDGAPGGRYWRRFTPGLASAAVSGAGLPAAASLESSAVGVASDGRVVVAYSRELSAGNDLAVRVFRADGTPLTGDLIANTGPVDDEFNQYGADVAVQPGGGFAVIWRDTRSGPELRARFFSGSTPAPTPPKATVGTLPAALTTTSIPLQLSYQSSQPFGSFDVQVRSAGAAGSWSAWAGWRSGLKSKSVTYSATAGRTYCFRARARTAAGLVGGYSAPRCTATPLDDRSLSATWGWKRGKQSGAFKGTITTTKLTGKRLRTGQVAARQVWLLVTKAPGSGKVKVTWAGKLLGTFSLAAGTTKKKVLIKLTTSGAPVRTGRLQLTTTTTKPVRIDGIVLRRD